ncbi:MAG: hypothetical protein SCM96_13220 [Acidobacteriota bacterium]|nr:hypothetical protein [Acidobacteriota bacterium]
MKARVLFRFHSVAGLVFGASFLAFPGFVSDFLALPTDSMGTIGWRFFGLGILAIAGIAFGSRNKTVDEVRFPIILVFFLLLIAMVLLKLALMFFTSLELNLWMWVVLGFHVLMAVAYGAYLFMGR